MENTVADGMALMTPERRKSEIPLAAAKLVLGGYAVDKFLGKKDVVGILFDSNTKPMHKDDFDIASGIADDIRDKWVNPLAKGVCLASPANVLAIVEMAQAALARKTDFRSGKRGIIMMADNDGSSFWRMRLPAKYMKLDGWWADITSAQVGYEQLLEYDVIFVQRFHTWESYYILARLKAAGRRIVYDIDDDLFSIPRDNPASQVIGRDEQFAAAEIIKLADKVTVSTQVLADRIRQIVGQEDVGKVVVVPNALDTLDGWRPTPLTGSPDGVRRIFWQGGSTHAADWTECIEAVERVMDDEQDVRLTILGFLPPVVMEMAQRRCWMSRIEYMGFSAPETYYQLVKHVAAEVGLAPLQQTSFNEAKSELKFMENTLIGMPTVASRVAPYMSVIDDGANGRLVMGVDEWVAAIKHFLGDRKARQAALMAARQTVGDRFDIRLTSEKWKSAITGRIE